MSNQKARNIFWGLILACSTGFILSNWEGDQWVKVASADSMNIGATSFPFSDNFETEALTTSWVKTLTGTGVVDLDTTDPLSGNQHLFIGQRVIGSSTASIILPIDLTGQTDVFLRFWWRSIGNTLNGNNGISISDDEGATWKKIANLSGSPERYSYQLINLATLASANNVKLNDKFQIRFYFDDFNGDIGGYRIDDLQVTSRSNVTGIFPDSDSFESQMFNQGQYPQTTGVGLIEIDSTDPYSGTHHLYLGQKTRGSSTADLIWAVNLTGRADVFLDFWWRSTGNTLNGNNGISISDDDGATWKKIVSLNGSPERYSRKIINLGNLTLISNLKLNDKFQIKFTFDDFNGDIGGYRIDDLQITTRSELVLPSAVDESFESQRFGHGQYPQTTNVGLVELDSTDPYSGTQHLYLGQKTIGSSTADLVWAIDLTGQTSVFLDFWWRSTGNTLNGNNGISISDDDGATWKKIADLNGSPERYTHKIINLGNLASLNNLKLNDKFQIKLVYDDFNGDIGGYRIDEFKIGASDPSLPEPVDRTTIYLPAVQK